MKWIWMPCWTLSFLGRVSEQEQLITSAVSKNQLPVQWCQKRKCGNKINPALVPVFFFRFPIPSRPPPSLLGHFPEISHGFALLLTGSWWPGTTITTAIDIHGSDSNDHQCNDSQWCYSQYFRSEISWKSVGVYGLLGCDNFSSSQFCHSATRHCVL